MNGNSKLLMKTNKPSSFPTKHLLAVALQLDSLSLEVPGLELGGVV